MPPRSWCRDAPVTLTLSGIVVAVWVACAIQSGSIFYTGNAPLAEAGLMYGPAVYAEPWGYARLLTSSFIHLSVSHVVLNTALLMLVGREIERALGSVPFAVQFFISAFGSSAAILVFEPLTPTAGASGALFGLMAVLVVVHLRTGVPVGGAVALVAVNVAYTFLASGVSLWGHLGGLITGAFLALSLLAPTRTLIRLFSAAVAAGVLTVIVSASLAIGFS